MPADVSEQTVTDPAERFSAAWDAFVLAVRRASLRGSAAPDALSLSQYLLLRPLLGGGGRPLGQLAEEAGVTAPTATRVIDGLQRSGVVRRARSRADRRAVQVSLTAEGRARMQRKRARIAAQRQRLYERLDPEERAGSERLLRHLAELLGEL
jgi:MarR family transcriptional regulator, organic hydroperoxide resistance regulator